VPNVILPENHIAYKSVADINELSKPILDLGIAMYVFARTFDDGSMIILSENKDIIHHHLKSAYKITIPIPEKFISDKFHYYLTPTKGYNRTLHDMVSVFNVDLGVDYIERQVGYYDQHYFSLPYNASNPINFYNQHVDRFEGFIKLFNDKTKNLLKNASKNKVLLPENMRPNVKGLESPDVALCFTEKELEVLKCIVIGYSNEDVADQVNLSCRTVEGYVETIREKLLVEKKNQICRKLVDRGLLDVRLKIA